MNEPTPSGSESVPAALAQQLDPICDRFEAEWRAGRRPRIENYLEERPESERPFLLHELLPLEVAYRRRFGEQPRLKEYQQRFPTHDPARLARLLTESPLTPASGQRGHDPNGSRPRHPPAQGVAPNANANSDRNLLFGVLALQMEFITRDALIRAMNAWVLDKAKPLGRILLDQGALRNDTHDLLEAMVNKHLELHGDDPQKSLAAVSSVGSVREELRQIADADLQASLAHVAAAPSSHADVNGTEMPVDAAAQLLGRRFRILRPHARGGLGEVFVAQDEELHRDVALKVIQEPHADHPVTRARFVREAEITGGLEHPGIVPIYGLGLYADGRPFYAMRFIKGDSLKEAVARFHQPESQPRPPGERTLELRKLLGRFVDVCDAVAYAHSRGVLHRDLKPSNVMLGKYGETLVVDWGLAKPVGRPEDAKDTEEATLRPASSGSGETLPGSALGTPQYMSPEQAAGRFEGMGPASDVYSLGATLYNLLTGKAPFTGSNVGDVLHKVQRGEFARPRQINRSVPPALEAICLKAMALKPENRYASARALAEEVEHWLADEPASAYREPLWTRLVGRHA